MAASPRRPLHSGIGMNCPPKAGFCSVVTRLTFAVESGFRGCNSTPSATITGFVHSFAPLGLRLTQIQTSGLRSRVPPK